MSVTASERFDERQQINIVKGRRFELPYAVNEDPEFKKVIPFLDQDPKWGGHFRKLRGNSTCSVVSLERGVSMEVDPLSWMADRVSLVDDSVPSKKISGLLVSMGLGRLKQTSSFLSEVTPVLPNRAPVIVVENGGGVNQEGLEVRRKILENAGTVERDILRAAPTPTGRVKDKLIWRSRMSAKRRRTEINFVDEGPMWRRRWVSEKIQKGANSHRGAGMKPLNAFEMGDQLRHSTNPPRDIGAAELGFGQEVLGPCGGCLWRVSVDGSWERVLNCGDSDCPGY